MKTIIILLGTMLASNSAFAQDNIYEWTGKDGVVVYSSQPPPAGTSARERTLKPAPLMGSSAPQPEVAPVQDDQNLTPAEQAQKNREELSRKRIEATSYEEALAIECDQARSVMEKLQQINNVAITDSMGNTRVIPEGERVARITLALEFVRDNCR